MRVVVGKLIPCVGAARRYFDYVNFNATGYRPYVTTLYAVLLGCARKTISRILVLIVSMGYGVVLPYLGAIQHKVGAPDSALPWVTLRLSRRLG